MAFIISVLIPVPILMPRFTNDRKEIMIRSKLRNKFNKYDRNVTSQNYKKQINQCVNSKTYTKTT